MLLSLFIYPHGLTVITFRALTVGLALLHIICRIESASFLLHWHGGGEVPLLVLSYGSRLLRSFCVSPRVEQMLVECQEYVDERSGVIKEYLR